MSYEGPLSDPSASVVVSPTQYAPLSSGEANFLWWFSQGSIMDVQVRRTLRGA
jgi:hypothetical protein